jgi:hypothetical protein
MSFRSSIVLCRPTRTPGLQGGLDFDRRSDRALRLCSVCVVSEFTRLRWRRSCGLGTSGGRRLPLGELPVTTRVDVNLLPSSRVHLRSAASLVAFAGLSAAPAFQLGAVQALAVLQAARLIVVLLLVVAGGLRIPNTGLWREFTGKYALFLFGRVVIPILVLRMPFSPPPDIGFLKRPLVLSAIRACELFLGRYSMLSVAEPATPVVPRRTLAAAPLGEDPMPAPPSSAPRGHGCGS